MTPTNKCSCVVKLEQLHATVRDELHPCKEHIYEARLSQLQGEIDNLQLRNDDLRGQLADITSVIANDPFLSNKFQGIATRLSEEPSKVYGIDLNPASRNVDVYRQLCILADRNRDLEIRLSSEKAVSMSWKHKIHDIENSLKSQLNDIIDMTADSACIQDLDHARAQSKKRDNLTKEALHLLKLARLRIDSDKHRIECLTNRISELESQLLEYRLNNPDAANHVVSSDVFHGLSSTHKEQQ